MKGTITTIKKGITLKDPILIVGLPGIGSVGKIVVMHLKKELKAKRIATLYSPHFPNQAIMTKDGGIRLVSNKFYLAKARNKKHDIVLLTGDSQAISPEGQFEVNSRIVKFFKHNLKGSTIITLGGYVANEGRVSNPRVFGNATSKKMIEEYKKVGVVFTQTKGAIWGSAGMVIAFAKLQGIGGICIMGETNFMDFDAMAAKAVLNVLSKKLDIKIKTENIDNLVKETAQAVADLEQQIKSSIALYGGGGEDSDSKISYIR
jgi:hypothetical protein